MPTLGLGTGQGTSPCLAQACARVTLAGSPCQDEITLNRALRSGPDLERNRTSPHLRRNCGDLEQKELLKHLEPESSRTWSPGGEPQRASVASRAREAPLFESCVHRHTHTGPSEGSSASPRRLRGSLTVVSQFCCYLVLPQGVSPSKHLPLRGLFVETNEPSSRRLSLNRSQYGGCSTKYNTAAGIWVVYE